MTSVEYLLHPRHTQSPTEVVEQMPIQGVLTGACGSFIGISLGNSLGNSRGDLEDIS